MDEELKKLLLEVIDELNHKRLQKEFIDLGHALGKAIDEVFGRQIEFVLVLQNPKKDVMSLGTMAGDEQADALRKAAKRLDNSEYKYAIKRGGKTIIKTREEMEQEAEQETKH